MKSDLLTIMYDTCKKCKNTNKTCVVEDLNKEYQDSMLDDVECPLWLFYRDNKDRFKGDY